MEQQRRWRWVAGLVALLACCLRGALAFEVDEECCEWWAESVEWPVGASECPVNPDDLQETYCCGLCFAQHQTNVPQGWLDDVCPVDDPLPAASGSASSSGGGFWGSAIALIVPAVFLILFFCAWLWLKDTPRGPAVGSGSTRGSSSSRLRSCYGVRSMPNALKFMLPTSKPQDSPALSENTHLQFCQPAGANDGVLSPVVVLGPPEEPVPSEALEEPVPGGPPEEPALPAE
ncbi:uncharacterized protein LOC132579263 [Heteronotia binoei]|uniref:uncharacterized protein LOC132579263 n=1 Tax=Heteronotia binoei TaxID=13085 RepID=UPI002930AF87|nr:uncharacterized protein LOC132579263 [Heteronotia binoei]